MEWTIIYHPWFAVSSLGSPGPVIRTFKIERACIRFAANGSAVRFIRSNTQGCGLGVTYIPIENTSRAHWRITRVMSVVRRVVDRDGIGGHPGRATTEEDRESDSLADVAIAHRKFSKSYVELAKLQKHAK